MNVKFTDYDTVKIGTEDEITTKDYFNLIEKKIRNGEITRCNYNPENEEFRYKCDDYIYIIKITNKSISKLRILLSFIELEKAESIKRKNAKITEDEKERLLRLARNGEIKSEEAKQLYLNELKDELKLTSLIKKLKLDDIAKTYFHLDVHSLSNLSEKISKILVAIAIIALIFIPAAVIFDELPANNVTFIMFVATVVELLISGIKYDNGGSIVARILSYLIWGIINLFGNLVKINIDAIRIIHDFIPKTKLIKHKIKSLEKYNLPIEEITLPKTNENSDVWSSYISKSIDNIYLNLLKLNPSDKLEIREELQTKLIEYKLALLNIPKSGLTLETEGTVNIGFIMYLAELELRINQKLNSKINNSVSTTSLEYMNEEAIIKDNYNDKTKKRVLKI